MFSQFDVLQPDVLYFSPDRAHLVDLNRVIRDAPDLCVEVLSPSTAVTNRGKKMQVFARFGVREYWIVDPAAESVEVYELGADGYAPRIVAAGSDAISPATLPGLTFTAGSLLTDR